MSKKNLDDQQLEALSALIDNSWSDTDENGPELLSGIGAQKPQNQLLREKFERYHLIRDAMHKELGPVDMSGFSSRIASAIADEPAIVSPARRGVTSGQSGLSVVDPSSSSVSETSAGESAQASSMAEHRERKQVREAAAAEKKAGFWSGRVGSGVGGFAVAASAAMVALLGYNLLEQQNPADPALGGNGVEVAATATSTPAAPVLNAEGVTNDVVVSDVVSPSAIANLSQPGNVQSVLPVANQQALEIVTPSTPAASIEYVSNTSTYWVRDGQNDEVRNPAMEKRLNHFLGKHIESAPTSRFNGFFPYSRLVGYDSSVPQPDGGEPTTGQ